MITIGANGNKITYGIKHYNLDDETDLKKLPVADEYMGCTCFVISTSKYYMLNSKKEWIEINPYGNASSTGGNTPGGDSSDKIIYEGGLI